MTPPRVRFAPSPTGLLHVGNARIALVNWLFARRAGGQALLRLDDTDRERSRPEFARAIAVDLGWLGLDWDGQVRQSERGAHYRAALDRLKAQGLAYPCFETAGELEARRRAQLAAGRPPVYDRAALALDAAALGRLESEGKKPHWRFRLPDGDVAWTDAVHGMVRIGAGTLSDPVLMREDGVPTYTLASVVDDASLGITDVLRGDDHLTNTAVQIRLFEALAAPAPRFAHLPLLVGPDGRKLSKREDGLALAVLREDGIEPLAVVSYLARLGTADPVEALPDLGAVRDGFAIDRFARSPPRFDPKELAALSRRVLHAAPLDAVRPRLAQLGLEAVDTRFWEAVRGNLDRLEDARYWWAVCHGVIEPQIVDPAVVEAAAAALPPEPWGPDTWPAWAGAAQAAAGVRGRALFRPLRLALTGREQGPELAALLPLIGRERALARLSGRAGPGGDLG